MQFSVIICTYNRSRNLSGCLTPLAEQVDVVDIDWEVVIVDNNSADNTREVVLGLSDELPIEIKYAFEKRQGLNFARNRGIEASSGRYFAFIDDDIVVTSCWLSSMCQAFDEHDADAVGGRIHLDPSSKLPSWISQEMYGFLGHQDFGEDVFQMDGASRYPFGGNMAFKRRVVDKIGLFNTALGRKGTGRKREELFKGAETDFFHRLSAAGGRIFYQPRAVVYHHILPFQLTKRYFRTIHYNAGLQKAYHDESEYQRTLMGVPLFLFPQLGRAIGKYLLQLVTKGADAAFRQQMTVGHFAGMIQGYVKRGHHA